MAPNKTKTIITAAPHAMPKRSRAARLLPLTPGELRPAVVLEQDEIHIGRGSECDVRVEEDSVSRDHAVVRRSAGGGWAFVDNGSTNGSFVNEQRVGAGAIQLRDGDLIRVGRLVFKFLDGVGIESTYHAELTRLGDVDSFTGVYNRAYAQAFLARELAPGAIVARPISIVLLDIDDFKILNDRDGHLAGDMALRAVAQSLLQQVRRHDVVARYGGEEFLVVLLATSHDDAMGLAERARSAIAAHRVPYEGREIAVTASFGVASATKDWSGGVEELLGIADRNLYAAKGGGKNRVVGGFP